MGNNPSDRIRTCTISECPHCKAKSVTLRQQSTNKWICSKCRAVVNVS